MSPYNASKGERHSSQAMTATYKQQCLQKMTSVNCTALQSSMKHQICRHKQRKKSIGSKAGQVHRLKRRVSPSAQEQGKSIGSKEGKSTASKSMSVDTKGGSRSVYAKGGSRGGSRSLRRCRGVQLEALVARAQSRVETLGAKGRSGRPDQV